MKKRSGFGFISGLLAGVIMTSLVVVLGYGIGQFMTEEEGSGTNTGNANVVMVQQDGIVSSEFLQKIDVIETLIDENFYLEEVSAEVLREGAYDGIVAALDDIYSVYYTPEEAEEVFQQSEGIYYGIGAYVQMDTVTGYAKITGTIKDTPAEEAGLQAGDILYKVNGEDMAGLDVSQVVLHIKGEEGTSVHLTLVRGNEYVEVDVERRKIESPTIEYSMLDDGMGYVQIVEFDDVTVNQFQEAVTALEKENVKGLILDLRGNPGGNLYSVVEIADMLLDKGKILYTEDKKGRQEVYNSGDGTIIDVPMVVLVDGNSASASEVLSGALKDHGKATLVGTTTFGKGIVQTIRTLKDGSAIKLTISAYYTPAGTNIHGTGIEPDVVVEFDGEAYRADGYDNQLEKAKEVLGEMLP
ncbi:MAG: S41 family peptidase [Lachnospiraceae bacterium]|nr:S41 family peptidase [Lachnospiraceae bacterium]